MDASSSLPGSPGAGPLQAITPEHVNRRDPIFSSLKAEGKDGSVHDKINQFNSLSIAMQSKQMERRTADAALKRAMVGREEAETELRRLREENKALRMQVEQGKERERKVGERLETVMDNYGRAKETHAHTQALWEKEIRRARKENFKSQSTIVKLQEELRSARSSSKSAEESLAREKERSKVREQEAFTARYQIVGVQEQLEKALERVKIVEQERDAFKTAARNEEVARIAAEGRIPLPATHDATDEFASPEKKRAAASLQLGGRAGPRVSLSTMEIVSSAASEMEIEELTTQVLWERQRADRAQEMVEFLQAECQMHLCACSKTSNARESPEAPQKRRRVSVDVSGERHDAAISFKEESLSPHSQRASSRQSTTHSLRSSVRSQEPTAEPEIEPQMGHHEPEPEVERPEVDVTQHQPQRIKSRKEPRRSTIFCPKEGIFRTVSEHEAAALDAQERAAAAAHPAVDHQTAADEPLPSPEANAHHRMYARTPSVEPPAFALLAHERNSLDFLLLDAPPDDAAPDAGSAPLLSIPSIPVVADTQPVREPKRKSLHEEDQSFSPPGSPGPRPHGASTASFTVTTTVPLREEPARSSTSLNGRLRTPSHGSNASFDYNDPAMTPTMTREQALAKIRERRGRARSAAQAAPSSSSSSSGKKPAVKTGANTGPRGRPVKRDMSAPTAKATPRFK
ncbi:uncharacterized protein UV8b_08243 [Ustilaginoidea virens]|uniref:PAP2 superfamily protein n=1 Tax=Ustilaginoidea virens TaxID=1159556 RepID=A0A8E5ML88_USTVR|nr:uncharacterized protein UV8b_08243 [Ustilaginoidea virens]QUC24002.1 hypothetical protein UV8b_08243 [Ustilaginoidea virens]